MLREFTCIMCPQGCDITVEVEGNRCPKGETYVTQEIVNPMRNIATSVLVDGGELPLASVRLSALIPKDRIFDVMDEIKKVKLEAPVTEGQVVIENVCGLNSNVIITKTVRGPKTFPATRFPLTLPAWVLPPHAGLFVPSGHAPGSAAHRRGQDGAHGACGSGHNGRNARREAAPQAARPLEGNPLCPQS